jgi:hypothetical protein
VPKPQPGRETVKLQVATATVAASSESMGRPRALPSARRDAERRERRHRERAISDWLRSLVR